MWTKLSLELREILLGDSISISMDSLCEERTLLLFVQDVLEGLVIIEILLWSISSTLTLSVVMAFFFLSFFLYKSKGNRREQVMTGEVLVK